MKEFRRQYDKDFKKNAVKLSYASPKPVREIAKELGINVKRIQKRLGYMSPTEYLRSLRTGRSVEAA
jgi:transposase-like protein